MAKALLLDFGSVISKSLFETLPDIESAYSLAEGSLAWHGPFAPEEDQLWSDMQAGNLSEREYYYTRSAELSALVGKEQKIIDIIQQSRGSGPSERFVRPEARAAVSSAKAAGCGVSILSNELELFYGAEAMVGISLLGEMDHIIDATHTKILKPDSRAYQMAEEALDLPKADIVFVDDQMKNIKGGEDYGLTCVFFDVLNPIDSYNQALAHLGAEPIS
jgi:putative hydrolase of the HAD superfamily